MLERAVAAVVVVVAAVGTKRDTMITPKYSLQENSL
jgi:hypothetical protein